MEPHCRHERVLWAAWLAGCITSFGVLEARAFHPGCHPTLSRCMARWLRCAPPARHRYVGPALFAGVWAVLAWHFVTLPEEPSRVH